MKNSDFLRCAVFGPGLRRSLPIIVRHSLLICTLLLCGAFPAPASAGYYEDLFGISRPASHQPGSAAVVPGHALRVHLARTERSRRHAEARHAEARRARRHFARHHPIVPAAAPSAPAFLAHVASLALTSGAKAIDAILNDLTLRPGDAYVGTDGVRIYVGSSNKTPEEKDFVPLTPKIMAKAKFRARLAPYRSTTPVKKLAAAEVKPKAASLPPPAGPAPMAAHAQTAGSAGAAARSPSAARLPSAAPLPPPRPAVQERMITDAAGKTIRLVGVYVPL